MDKHYFSVANAEALGVYLNIPMHVIKALKKDNVGDATALLFNVIKFWLFLAEPISSKLAKALEIAEEIRSKLIIIITASYMCCCRCGFVPELDLIVILELEITCHNNYYPI